MLEQILNYLHNWFAVGIYTGEYTIQESGITLPFLQNGQYFRIIGSVFNDGLHQYGPEMKTLTDETFNGTIWALSIPGEVVTLSNEMTKWESKNGTSAAGIYQSESFGGYSYAKATNATGGVLTVFDAFRARLKPYQKICGMR